jgi:TolB-like protein/Tfp pilus assembly protein PilF
MKRCPECRRDYYDETLLYCLDDGNALLDGPASREARREFTDEPATAILSNSGLAAAAVSSAEPRTEVLSKTPSATTAVGNSIAVLPFVDMSGDTGNEYFCDGLAEELLNALSKIDELKVAARTSAFSFKGTNTDVTQIGQKLGVRTILGGGVRRSGDRMRVTVQLVNAADGYHLWSERYDRELKDIFDVQDEIALAVVDALKLKLLGHKKEALLKRHTEDPQARELLLKGRFYRAKISKEGLTKAIEYFEQAIAIDPNYGLAYADLATTYHTLGSNSFMDPKGAGPKAEAALTKALELDEDLAEAHTGLGNQRRLAWDWTGAESSFQRAVELNPNLAVARICYSSYLSRVGRHERSLEETKRAAELDPLRLVILANVGYSLDFARRYEEAIEQYRKTLEMDGNYGYAIALSGYAYAAKGDYEQAIASYQKYESVIGAATSEQCYLAYALAKAGRREEAEAIRTELESTTEYVSLAELALLHAGLGETEPAFSALERAYSEHDPQLQFLGTEPHYDSLRDDPRFDDLLRRIGLPKQIYETMP